MFFAVTCTTFENRPFAPSHMEGFGALGSISQFVRLVATQQRRPHNNAMDTKPHQRRLELPWNHSSFKPFLLGLGHRYRYPDLVLRRCRRLTSRLVASRINADSVSPSSQAASAACFSPSGILTGTILLGPSSSDFGITVPSPIQRSN